MKVIVRILPLALCSDTLFILIGTPTVGAKHPINEAQEIFLAINQKKYISPEKLFGSHQPPTGQESKNTHKPILSLIQEHREPVQNFASGVKKQLGYIMRTKSWIEKCKWLSESFDFIVDNASQLSGHGELKPEELDFMRRYVYEGDDVHVYEIFKSFEAKKERVELFKQIAEQITSETSFEELKKILEKSTKGFIERPEDVNEKEGDTYKISSELYVDVVATNLFICGMYENGLFKQQTAL